MRTVRFEETERSLTGHPLDAVVNAPRAIRAGGTQLYVVTAPATLILHGLTFRAASGGGILRSISVHTRCQRSLGIEVTTETTRWNFDHPMEALVSVPLVVEIENPCGEVLQLAELVWWGRRSAGLR